MKKITTILPAILSLSVTVVSLPVKANWNDGLEEALVGGLPANNPESIITSLLEYTLSFLAGLFVLSLIISGIMLIVSGGGDLQKKAKSWIGYSITGLVISLSGYIIVKLVDFIL